jgi:hypothetical protein
VAVFIASYLNPAELAKRRTIQLLHLSQEFVMNQIVTTNADHHIPWNKGKLIGQKYPLKLKEIWAIRIRLQLANRIRELALFNLSIDSKLRGCDLVKLRVCDVAQSNRVSTRAMIMQQKTHRPVQFEITEQTRESLGAWINQVQLKSDQYLFPSRIRGSLTKRTVCFTIPLKLAVFAACRKILILKTSLVLLVTYCILIQFTVSQHSCIFIGIASFLR